MLRILRRLKMLVAFVLGIAVGSLPACGTMGGGGGMKYLIDPMPEAWIAAYA